jgi:cation transport regulator ChaC
MWIIAYGSLMDPKLLEHKKHKLAIVKGWKRIFNKVVIRNLWKKYASGKQIGTVTVIKSPGSSFNGVAFMVSDKEFSDLKKREEDYHIEKTEAWDFKTDEKLGECILFVSGETREDILPIKEYLQVCRDAAYSWGEAFGKEYDRTTFLADGTSIDSHKSKKKSLPK